MDQEAFDQAKKFIFQDVRREICLARASESENGRKALKNLGVAPGGGNFIAALALLCYTEFGGKLRFNRNNAGANFNEFFDSLGQEYKRFRASHHVYDTFRCGLAHEYYVKENCTIYMLGADSKPGIGIDEAGKYYFVVERYCDDLENAFKALEGHLFSTTIPN